MSYFFIISPFVQVLLINLEMWPESTCSTYQENIENDIYKRQPQCNELMKAFTTHIF